MDPYRNQQRLVSLLTLFRSALLVSSRFVPYNTESQSYELAPQSDACVLWIFLCRLESLYPESHLCARNGHSDFSYIVDGVAPLPKNLFMDERYFALCIGIVAPKT